MKWGYVAIPDVFSELREYEMALKDLAEAKAAAEMAATRLAEASSKRFHAAQHVGKLEARFARFAKREPLPQKSAAK